MARIDPLNPADTPELTEVYAIKEANLGFIPNSTRTMARWPEFAAASGAMSAAMTTARHLPPGLGRLVFLVASMAGGCRYCQAHSAHCLKESGVPPQKLAAVWEYESSPLFDEAERAALRLASAAGASPPYVSDDHFAALREHFDDDAIIEIVGFIAYSGFLNRWNATLAIQLEDAPLATARQVLAPGGWTPGQHNADEGNDNTQG